MNTYKGDVLFAGFAFGKLVFSMQGKAGAARKSKGAEQEQALFAKARDQAVAETKSLQATANEKLSKVNAEILDAHLVMLEDPDFNDLVAHAIKDGKNAEAAVDEAVVKLATMLKATGDAYIAERAADVEEIGGMIKQALIGSKATPVITGPTILVSDSFTVAQLLSLDTTKVKGLALLNTGKTSHVSIVIRSLGIPSVILADRPADNLVGADAILDAVRGVLYTGYDSKLYAGLRDDSEKFVQETVRLKSYLNSPTVTKDGKKTTLYANISTPEEAALAAKSGAEGIGLFRSEFIYMNSSDYPSEDVQFAAYCKALETMRGKPVVIRTFDIGSDKKAAYFDLPAEANPALGYRSIRICRDRPELFLTQLKALYRASAHGDLSIMIPMIISPGEIDFVHEMCVKAKAVLTQEGLAFDPDLKVGIMVETPAAAITSDILAKKADFFSIGTNDLSQYTLAIDRTNENLAKFFDPHHKAIMRLIAKTVENGHRFGTPVSICGELAHDEKLLPFFLKIGIDHLSMPSSYILKTRELISHIDTAKVDLADFI